MFDKIGQAAEKMAIGVSRRAFLGRFGRMAAVAAGVVGGLLTTRNADAAPTTWCCLVPGTYGSSCYPGKCQPKYSGTTVKCRDWIACQQYW